MTTVRREWRRLVEEGGNEAPALLRFLHTLRSEILLLFLNHSIYQLLLISSLNRFLSLLVLVRVDLRQAAEYLRT